MGILTRRDLIATVGASALTLLSAPLALAQEIYEPRPGTAERAAILDAVRPAIEASMRGPVEFVVNRLNVSGPWAFLSADPQRPGGAPIDPFVTAFANDIDFMDGLTVYALARRAGAGWALVDHMVGPTDVGYAYWPQHYGVPPRVLGL